MTEEMRDDTFDVSIKGEGVMIEKKRVAAPLARQLINILMGGGDGYEHVLAHSVTVHGSTPKSAPGSSGEGASRTSLREYLDETQATRNPDKITAMGQYLLLHENVGEFTRDDIKGRFRTAGEVPPANFPRDFSWAVKNGWIAEDPKKPGAFYVTQKGRVAIEGRFSDGVKKSTSQPSARRRSRKRGSNSQSEGEAE
jgi:hypothetical protein